MITKMGLDSMRYAGKVNQSAITWGFHKAIAGATLEEVSLEIEKYITNAGCKAAFKGYSCSMSDVPFPGAACMSPNDTVVHGVPNGYIIQPGDLLTIDVGTYYEGYFVDAARTQIVPGKSNSEGQILIDATEEVVGAQLSIIKDGCTLLDLVEVSEEIALKNDIVIFPQWGGHGIGSEIHMEPFIPSAMNYDDSPIKQQIDKNRFKNQILKNGDTICIEPVTTTGDTTIIISEDGWTVKKTDGNLAAHYEKCLLVTKKGYEILS